ncbi:hypothetical protein BC830DRAFT_1234597, partial [Chytriomyces sp. MP71]
MVAEGPELKATQNPVQQAITDFVVSEPEVIACVESDAASTAHVQVIRKESSEVSRSNREEPKMSFSSLISEQGPSFLRGRHSGKADEPAAGQVGTKIYSDLIKSVTSGLAVADDSMSEERDELPSLPPVVAQPTDVPVAQVSLISPRKAIVKKPSFTSFLSAFRTRSTSAQPIPGGYSQLASNSDSDDDLGELMTKSVGLSKSPDDDAFAAEPQEGISSSSITLSSRFAMGTGRPQYEHVDSMPPVQPVHDDSNIVDSTSAIPTKRRIITLEETVVEAPSVVMDETSTPPVVVEDPPHPYQRSSDKFILSDVVKDATVEPKSVFSSLLSSFRSRSTLKPVLSTTSEPIQTVGSERMAAVEPAGTELATNVLNETALHNNAPSPNADDNFIAVAVKERVAESKASDTSTAGITEETVTTMKHFISTPPSDVSVVRDAVDEAMEPIALSQGVQASIELESRRVLVEAPVVNETEETGDTDIVLEEFLAPGSEVTVVSASHETFTTAEGAILGADVDAVTVSVDSVAPTVEVITQGETTEIGAVPFMIDRDEIDQLSLGTPSVDLPKSPLTALLSSFRARTSALPPGKTTLARTANVHAPAVAEEAPVVTEIRPATNQNITSVSSVCPEDAPMNVEEVAVVTEIGPAKVSEEVLLSNRKDTHVVSAQTSSSSWEDTESSRILAATIASIKQIISGEQNDAAVETSVKATPLMHEYPHQSEVTEVVFTAPEDVSRTVVTTPTSKIIRYINGAAVEVDEDVTDEASPQAVTEV